MNKSLRKYIRIFHDFTFKIGKYHQNESEYEKRLENNLNEWIPIVEKARLNFLHDYVQHTSFKDAYHEYMNKNFDFILFVNVNVSAPDQRKYGDGSRIPFTAYWYQVVIWELFNSFSIAYYKSRDAGLSFTVNAGETMMLCHAKASESIIMSRTEKEVDITGDRSQTSMGRIRSIIESSKLYNLDEFKINKFLRLFRTERVGVFGAATSPNAGSGNRARRGLIDEAGKILRLREIRQSLTSTAKHLMYAGTLKAGTDTGLRDSIKNSHEINPLEIWNSFKKELKELKDYRKAWDKVKTDLKNTLPKGKSITFKNTYRDHPLKSGNCDYREIECNRLFNDPVAIAHELDADLNAPSPDRTLYNASKAHIKDQAFFNNIPKNGLFWIGGFDPGSIDTTCFVPMLGDYEGRIYVFPKVYMTEGNMISFIQKMGLMAPNMTLYPEESVKAYSRIDSGWYPTLKKYANIMKFDIQISKNRDIEGIGLITNYCLSETEYNPITQNEEQKILIHEDNEEWLMNYKHGMKRSGDKDQKKWSHAAEAFMSAIYEINRKRDIFRNRADYQTF